MPRRDRVLNIESVLNLFFEQRLLDHEFRATLERGRTCRRPHRLPCAQALGDLIDTVTSLASSRRINPEIVITALQDEIFRYVSRYTADIDRLKEAARRTGSPARPRYQAARR
jgi:hypothetical protein